LNRKALLLLPVAIITLTNCFLAQKTAPQKINRVNWQALQMVNVELLVSDHDGVLGQYDALFIVNGPGGKEWKVSKHTDGGDVRAFFPEDFHLVAAPTGKYTWKCIVKNEVIVEGQFDYEIENTNNSARLELDGINFR
jgi:hypothetical protein